MRKIIITLIFGLTLIGAELAWYKHIGQQTLQDTTQVVQTYKESVEETQKQTLAIMGNSSNLFGNQTASPPKPTDGKVEAKKKIEKHQVGKICSANKCFYKTETVESTYSEEEKNWVESKRTLDTEKETVELNEFEAKFKPSRKCQDPNINWDEFVKCQNAKITARETFYGKH